jgi:hypothetical protein
MISMNLQALGDKEEDIEQAWEDLEERGIVTQESTLIGDIRGVDVDRYRLSNQTDNIDDCVLCGRPVANEMLSEGGLNPGREVIGKAHARCLFPETWPGELRFLPLGL